MAWTSGSAFQLRLFAPSSSAVIRLSSDQSNKLLPVSNASYGCVRAAKPRCVLIVRWCAGLKRLQSPNSDNSVLRTSLKLSRLYFVLVKYCDHVQALLCKHSPRLKLHPDYLAILIVAAGNFLRSCISAWLNLPNTTMWTSSTNIRES